MSGQGYKRHIPQGNSPDEMRVSHTRIWDAIDSLRRESQQNAQQVSQLAAQGASTATPAPTIPAPTVTQVGFFSDIFLMMGG